MRNETFLQIEVVEGETAKEFQHNFNSKIRELAQTNCKIYKDRLDINADELTAIILYEITESYMDCVADEFHAEGIYFHKQMKQNKVTPIPD